MEDVLTETPPPSRFFQEDLDNFAAPSPPLPAPILLLNANPNPSLLIIAISAPSLALIHRIPSKTVIGTLILPEILLSGNPLHPSPRDRSCRIYSTGSSTILAAVQYPVTAVQYPVTAERSRAVARCILNSIPAERVLVLDSIRGANFRGRLSGDEGVVAKLETTGQRRASDRLACDVEYLPSGSVLDGLGAALVGECQMRRGKGTMIATWPESGPVPFLRSLLRDAGVDVGGEVDGDDAEGFGVNARYGAELYT